MDRDLNVLLITRALRTFGMSYLSFLLPIYLRSLKFSYAEIGIYVLLTTLSSSVLVIVSGFLGDLWSKKYTLVLMSGLPVVAYALLVSGLPSLVFLSSLFGITMGGGGGGAGGGPVAPLTSSMIAERSSGSIRTKVYSFMMVASTITGVAGSVLSSAVISFVRDYFVVLFALSLILDLVSTVLVLLIREKREKAKEMKEEKKVIPRRSLTTILKVSFAGGAGSLGLGLVIPFIPLYMKHLGASDLMVSEAYDVSYAAIAFVTFFSYRIESALGSLNGIVVLRGLGSALLIAIPLFPSFLYVALIYVVRTALYQAALPMRQNMTMDLYDEKERSRGASISGLFRRLPYGVGSSLGSLVIAQGLYLLDFFGAGIVSLLDPVLYYYFFKKREKKEQEEAKASR
ncbi:MFS transporter [Sulfuracidifex tepidarius]|uniref:Major facilitator superfamily (MFS) profile domain-containing protein n=1 Tax=Sulfuracidifex tepidarius TaxID=1294262 RepID=A0A510E173_9CREN|nr:MFS transporter [Sulfuracidifex tepidarius]BBG23480.1 hypothetical protein IC006_0764 [Sulfuracidifex tepidarius]BBG26233.1 hypothetical protein IC007_0738 [Sulfuracidifex tepidarius]